MGAPGWLSEYSVPAVREALRSAAPELADLPITLESSPDLDNPTWASGNATVGGGVFGKFALSEATAVRIWREAQLLGVLGELDLRVPPLVASSRDPAFSSTELVAGEPLRYADVAAAPPETFAGELASFLARLHAPEVLRLARARVESMPCGPEAGMHVSTDDLRRRFLPMIEPGQRSMVAEWCDWVDRELATPGETVLVHGDFHPYNQLWDLEAPRLNAVVDFESSGLGEPEFDFRVLPAFGPGTGLLIATVERYEAVSGRTLSVPRIMALHLLNYLGDALWRTEAGIALPEPGDSPAAYAREAASRLAALGL